MIQHQKMTIFLTTKRRPPDDMKKKKIKQITYRETDGSTFTFICKLQKCLTHQRTKKFTTEVEKMIQSYLFKTI